MRSETIEGPKCHGCGCELKPNDMTYSATDHQGRKIFTHAESDCWHEACVKMYNAAHGSKHKSARAKQ